MAPTICGSMYYVILLGPFYLILALPQMINEGCASLRILTAVEAIQFCSDEVQCLIGVEELGQQRWVISLEDKKLAALYNTLQYSVHLSYRCKALPDQITSQHTAQSCQCSRKSLGT